MTFHVTSGGGSVFSGASMTSAEGEAQDRWTLGTHVSDAQQVEARAVDPTTGAPLVFATFSATAVADAVASLIVSSGDAQSAPRGAPLAAACKVALADRYGNPVADQAVSWTVVSGGGNVSPMTSASDASGIASTVWTLGRGAGGQSLEAAARSFAVHFSADARTPSLIEVATGDDQAAAPGGVLPAPPVAAVRDANNQPVAGAAVTFAVVLGGGTVDSASATTDANGYASCGRWTLGAASGLNTLTASVEGIVQPATFAAAARKVSPDVSISLLLPIDWHMPVSRPPLVGPRILVVASVLASSGIASVLADGQGVIVPLSFGVNPYGGYFSGTLDLGNAPRGLFGLRITATDTAGQATELVVPLILDGT